jgi:hypothetical protein
VDTKKLSRHTCPQGTLLTGFRSHLVHVLMVLSNSKQTANQLTVNWWGAEVARYLTSGHAYVQDERYAAGAWMRTTAGMQEVEQRRSSCRGAAGKYYKDISMDIQ